jgi:hypothetical protein
MTHGVGFSRHGALQGRYGCGLTDQFCPDTKIGSGLCSSGSHVDYSAIRR